MPLWDTTYINNRAASTNGKLVNEQPLPYPVRESLSNRISVSNCIALLYIDGRGLAASDAVNILPCSMLSTILSFPSA